jgi:hypothetical protein
MKNTYYDVHMYVLFMYFCLSLRVNELQGYGNLTILEYLLNCYYLSILHSTVE